MANEEKRYPKLRFKGFTAPWEKRKLGNHANILTGGTPNTQHPEYWKTKEIPWMSSGEINKKYLDQTDTKISLQGFQNSSAR